MTNQTAQLNSVSIGTFKRSSYLSARYGHFITEEAISRGWKWNSECRAFTSAKTEEKEWLKNRFAEYKKQVENAVAEKEAMVKAPFVKFDFKEIAKENGGKWDSQEKVWLLPADKVEAVKNAIDALKVETQKEAPERVEKPASQKQKAIIYAASEDWFDIFDGASGYGMHGPTSEQLAEMTSREASNLIDSIFHFRNHGY
tara:strand:+ start:7608 stop:8207 length:600 start_codon:yes stop_codon:yes gene_type:complete